MADSDWITPQEAAKLSGLSVKGVRARLAPGHSDHIPNYLYEGDDGRMWPKIDRKSFLMWREAHSR